MVLFVLMLVAALALGGCSDPLSDYEYSREELGYYNAPEVYQESGAKPVKEYDDHFIQAGSRYYKMSLDETRRLWYEDIEHILGSMQTYGELSEEGVKAGLTEKDLEHIFTCVCMDHPEFFYVEGFSYVAHVLGDNVIGYTFSGNYSVDRAEALEREREIETAYEEFRLALAANEDPIISDYDLIKYVYETVIRQTDYVADAPDNQSIYSVLVGRKSVCQGYSKTLQFLLNKLGVECTLIQGTAFGESHGWNLVKADGDYYYVDVTWGDNSYHPDASGEMAPEILYEYLCVTTEEILKEHSIDMIVPLPVCTSTKDNYYVQEGAYFTDLDEVGLKWAFRKASPENYYQVAIKCATQECYETVRDFLLEKNKIFDYYTVGSSRISYYENPEMLSMTFWVTN
ncbi:MAG: hypothetical protein J6Z22_07255 [Lachnospiraceae bacterium]|nr:hypothetical protein [Lachnospiraceae bacterium]